MSDKPEGPGWWIASDGKWYAPELHPSVRDDAAPRAKAPAADPAQPQRWQGQAEKATTQVGPRFPDLFQKALEGSHLVDNVSVNYAGDDLRGALRRLGGEHGIDVVYDPVGGPYAEPAVRSLAWLGRYLVVGFAAGEIPKLPLNLVLLRGCDIRGVFWGAWIRREPQAQRAIMTDIVKWCAEGKLSAHVHAVYPLAEIATALKAISDRKVMGKILLRP